MSPMNWCIGCCDRLLVRGFDISYHQLIPGQVFAVLRGVQHISNLLLKAYTAAPWRQIYKTRSVVQTDSLCSRGTFLHRSLCSALRPCMPHDSAHRPDRNRRTTCSRGILRHLAHLSNDRRSPQMYQARAVEANGAHVLGAPNRGIAHLR